MSDPEKLEALLKAAIPHVVFDGWSESVLGLAAEEIGFDPAEAQRICPRGIVDLAIAYHRAGDQEMKARFDAADTTDLRIREKVALAINLRLENADKEIVRRGTALFALPHLATDGAALLWGTADAIWSVLGDNSDDLNWYTKRATLSALYASVVLYWLGDSSEDGSATRTFIDRRIDNVMSFEKFKAGLRKFPVMGSFIDAATAGVKAPGKGAKAPGYSSEGS